MPGVRNKEFGPGWVDVANCARELENDYSVVVLITMRPLCPPGYTEMGLQLVISALRGEGDEMTEVWFRVARYRPAGERGSLPAQLYGLLVKQFGDCLEQKRQEERRRSEDLKPGQHF